MLASGDDDGIIRLWDVADPAHPRPLGQPPTNGGRRGLGGVQPRRTHAGQRQRRRQWSALWDVADPAHPRPLGQLPATGGAVDSVAFSPDGHALAGGSLDGMVRLWDVADPRTSGRSV